MLWELNSLDYCWAAIPPPFSRYAVIPVARNVWQQVEEGSPASSARRFTIRRSLAQIKSRSLALAPLSRYP